MHVVTDSDELQMFELTTVEREVVPAGSSAGASVWSVAVMAAKCDELQLDYWRCRTIYLHVSDLDERWTAATITAEKFAHRALRSDRTSGWHVAGPVGSVVYASVARATRRCGFANVVDSDLNVSAGGASAAGRGSDSNRLSDRRSSGFIAWSASCGSWTHRSTKTLRKTLLRATRRVFRLARAR